MFDALHEHLRTTATPVEMNMVQEATELFDRFDLADWETGFFDILLTGDNMEPSAVNDNIYGLIQNLQDQILASFQIKLDDDATAYDANKVLRCIAAIEDSELKSDISAAIQEVMDPEDTFCELCQIAAGEEPVSLHPVVAEVGERFYTALREHVKVDAEDDERQEIDIEAERKMINRLIRLKEYLGNNALMVYQMIVDGVRVGMPYSSYHDDIMPLLMTSQPNVIAAELYAASMVACDTQNESRKPILAELNKTFTSVDVITPITVALEQLILRFRATENSGITKVS